MSLRDNFDTRPKVSEAGAVVSSGRFPKWLHRPLPVLRPLSETHGVINSNRVHTVCEEAKCPNLLECYSKKTATFLVMGKECTRNCGFCDIDFAKEPKALDGNEPERVAESAYELGLRHVVITMVARDDLPDGGAKHLVEVLQAVRKRLPAITVETLTSDFAGNFSALDLIIEEAPEIFNHNIETVRRITPQIRHKATYDRSLSLLSYVKKQKSKQLVKSGIMIGLGETKEEVTQTLQDLAEAQCDIVTIGQYLQASRKKLTVKEFIHPDVFLEYEQIGKSLGIPNLYAGPFVRSSYNSHLFVEKNNEKIVINSH
ncbi:MAG: lipoyl synthase [Verrucomicrobia bacterium]|nr:lipoyl synthase [Verrucomicrobiota bacterium]